MADPSNGADGGAPYRIDYERLDIADLMEQVRARAAARPRPSGDDAAGGPSPDDPDALFVDPSPLPEAPPSRLRRILLRLSRPFTPLLKLLVLPVADELARTIRILDHAQRRVDHLVRKTDRTDRVLREFQERTRTRLEPAREDLKLLHNLAHNLVVELTKLKIEHEALKSKTRILEKDFETLSRRERAVETKVAP